MEFQSNIDNESDSPQKSLKIKYSLDFPLIDIHQTDPKKMVFTYRENND